MMISTYGLQANICYFLESFVSDYSLLCLSYSASSTGAMGMLMALLCNLYGGD